MKNTHIFCTSNIYCMLNIYRRMADLDTNCFLRVLVSPDTRVSFRWIVSLYVRRMASTLTRSGGLPLVRSLDRCSTLSEAWASTAQGGTVDLPGMERRAWMVLFIFALQQQQPSQTLYDQYAGSTYFKTKHET